MITVLQSCGDKEVQSFLIRPFLAFYAGVSRHETTAVLTLQQRWIGLIFWAIIVWDVSVCCLIFHQKVNLVVWSTPNITIDLLTKYVHVYRGDRPLFGGIYTDIIISLILYVRGCTYYNSRVWKEGPVLLITLTCCVQYIHNVHVRCNFMYIYYKAKNGFSGPPRWNFG